MDKIDKNCRIKYSHKKLQKMNENFLMFLERKIMETIGNL